MVSVESNFNERAFFGKLLKRTDFRNVFRTLPNIHDEGFVEKRLNNFQLLFLQKSFIIDVLQGSKYAFLYLKNACEQMFLKI